jgi:hypothetical protein
MALGSIWQITPKCAVEIIKAPDFNKIGNFG